VAGVGPGAWPGDGRGARAGADGRRRRREVVVVAGRAVVPLDPLLGAGGRVVGDGGVVIARAAPVAKPGDEHRAPARADHQLADIISEVAGAVVPLDPQLGTGDRVVGDGGVIVVRACPGAGPGDA